MAVAKILIVDDDLEIQELLRYTLEAEQYQVIIAADGEEALRCTFEEHPDLILLDVNIPKLSGFEVCEKIRENPATALIPIIMLTSLSKTKDRVTGIKLGANEYINKPFEPFELVAHIDGLLKRTREMLAANPLTGLPGNVTIEGEIKRRLESQEAFSVVYADIDNFKSFNDKYGFSKGDTVIRLLSSLMRNALVAAGNKDDCVGHVGGEDFVIITSAVKVNHLCEKIIESFDAMIVNQYDEDVRARGYIWGTDRSGNEVKYPLMTISLGVVGVEPGAYQHYSQVVDRAKEMLRKAKQQEGSIYVLD